jgi:hypothetical protein
MTAKVNGTGDLVGSAYEVAWQKYCSLPGLTTDEKVNGPNKLR